MGVPRRQYRPGSRSFQLHSKRVNKERGVIGAGKLADAILVDGDPTKNIRDINQITTVIKGGKVYDPVAIEKALGITPRKARP